MVLGRAHTGKRAAADDIAEGAQEVGQDRYRVRFGTGLESANDIAGQPMKRCRVQLGPRQGACFGCPRLLTSYCEPYLPPEDLFQLRVETRRDLFQTRDAGCPAVRDGLLRSLERVGNLPLGTFRKLPANLRPRLYQDALRVSKRDLAGQQDAAQVREVLVAAFVGARRNVRYVAGDGIRCFLSQLFRYTGAFA